MMRLLIAALAICFLAGWFGSPCAQEPGYDTAMDSVSAQTQSDSISSVSQSKPHVIKRDFNARQQVVVGSAIMTFIVVIITTVSNWNP